MQNRPNGAWGFATFLLLVASLVVAVTHGRIIEAVVIGVLTIPAALFVVGWIMVRTR